MSTAPAEVSAAVTKQRLPVLLAVGLAGLAWVLPFLSPNFREPIATFYGEAVAFALGLAAIACLLFRPLWDGLALPRASLVLLGFVLLLAAQLALGKYSYPQLHLLGALYLLWAAALALLGSRLARVMGAQSFAATLSWFALAGAAISALVGLMQLWGVQTPFAPLVLPQIHDRIYANTGQPNHLASQVCIGLISLGYLWATRRLSAAPAVLLALLLLAALTVCGSRAVWAYLPGLALLAGAKYFLGPDHSSKRLLIFAISAMLGLIVVQWLYGYVAASGTITADTVAQRLRDSGLGSPVRLRFWHEAWLMFLQAPILGVGFKQFAWNSFLLAVAVPGTVLDHGVIDHAHNLVFQIGAEFGIAGLLLLVAGLIWWMRGLRGVPWTPELWWTLSILAVLGLHSMLEYPLWYAYFLGIAAVAMGAAESAAMPVGNRRGGRLILAMVVVLGVLSFANVYRDYRTLQSLRGLQAQQSRSAPESGDESIRILLGLQGQSLFAPYVELALVRRMLLSPERLQDKLLLNSRVMRFLPANDLAYRQAILLAMSGDAEAARSQWDLAVENYPRDRDGVVALLRGLAAGGTPGLEQLLQHAQKIETEVDK